LPRAAALVFFDPVHYAMSGYHQVTGWATQCSGKLLETVYGHAYYSKLQQTYEAPGDR
jgi:hypothetical protein